MDGLLYIINMVMIIIPCDCSLTWKSILNVHLINSARFQPANRHLVMVWQLWVGLGRK